MDIQLSFHAARPLYLQLRDALRTRLLSGAVPGGSRLPASRELAANLHISRNTVNEAYRMLSEEGLIRIVRGQGAFACAKAEEVRFRSAFPWKEKMTPLMLSYANYRTGLGHLQLGGENTISFASLAPDHHFFDTDDFRRCMDTVLSREGSVLLAYGYSGGYRPLIEFLQTYLKSKGLPMERDRIQIVNGFRQGAGLVVQTLVSPSDTVLVEAPTYNGFLGILRACGARAVPLACDEEGILPSALEEAIQKERPKLLYLIPTYHNPTGRNMSLQRRYEILELASHAQLPILEDGFNEELRFKGESHPSLKALDRNGLVVYVGSFSKVLFPGLRVGWVVGDQELMQVVAQAKYNQDIHTSALLQAALCEYLARGYLEKYLRVSRSLYRQRMDAFLQNLHLHFADRAVWDEISGGFSAYLRFPSGFDARKMLPLARDRGVLYAPGDLFYPDGRGQNEIRLGFPRLKIEEAEKGMRILSECIRETGF